MPALKLTAVGTSTGLVIPKEMLSRMKVEKGDVLHAIETEDGYLLTPYDAEVQRQLELGREFMKEFREAFRALGQVSSEIEISWVNQRTLLALHRESLLEHGGLHGLRDEGLLNSALARPQHILNYNQDASLAELAAAYSVGIARNHPFNDGNKRAALLVIGLFLRMHGYRLGVSQQDAVLAMLAVASGEMGEPELSAWIGKNLVAL